MSSQFVAPTDEEKGRMYGQLARELWQVNKGRAELMNEMAAKLKGLPPIVLTLPEVPAFLSHVQQLAFFLGVAATMNFIEDAHVERTAPDEGTVSGEAK